MFLLSLFGKQALIQLEKGGLTMVSNVMKPAGETTRESQRFPTKMGDDQSPHLSLTSGELTCMLGI